MHKTVLLHEVIEGLNLTDGATVVDATFGGGGHSLEIYKKFPNVKIIALDQDKSALERGEAKFSAKGGSARGGKGCDISFHNLNFRNLGENLLNFGQVDGIIFDLGLSSDQLEDSGRGFSFLRNEPLLMQMKHSPEDVTAEDVVNTWSEESLAKIIYGYGEEKFAKRIGRGIVEAREKAEIKTTFDLVKIISNSVPAVYRRGKIHPATRTFQAVRIAVNDELGALLEGLEKGFKFLKSGGRMAVISFHSLEDRIVKKFYKAKAEEGLGKLVPARNASSIAGAGGNKKVILPSSEEIKSNPRARSAKLRIIEKIK